LLLKSNLCICGWWIITFAIFTSKVSSKCTVEVLTECFGNLCLLVICQKFLTFIILRKGFDTQEG
jgi:hypothetical protein